MPIPLATRSGSKGLVAASLRHCRGSVVASWDLHDLAYCSAEAIEPTRVKFVLAKVPWTSAWGTPEKPMWIRFYGAGRVDGEPSTAVVPRRGSNLWPSRGLGWQDTEKGLAEFMTEHRTVPRNPQGLPRNLARLVSSPAHRFEWRSGLHVGTSTYAKGLARKTPESHRRGRSRQNQVSAKKGSGLSLTRSLDPHA